MFFIISKIFWIIFNPFNLLIILFLFGLFFSFINLKKISIFFYTTFALLLIVSVFLPTGNYLTFLLEKKYHSSNQLPKFLDGILILSGSTDAVLTKEYNQVVLNDSSERLIESVKLIKIYKNIKVIYSGGSGNLFNSELDNAYVAQLFFTEMGIDKRRIIYEKKSRNTYENILFSKTLAEPLVDEKWLIVTSAMHLRRAMNVSHKLKWNLIPYPVDFQNQKKFKWELTFDFYGNFSKFQKASREWLGLIYYYFSNKSNKIY